MMWDASVAHPVEQLGRPSACCRESLAGQSDSLTREASDDRFRTRPQWKSVRRVD